MDQGGSRRVLEVAKTIGINTTSCQQADTYENAGGPTTVMSARQGGICVQAAPGMWITGCADCGLILRAEMHTINWLALTDSTSRVRVL